ncbi:MAG: hypothetical protein ACLRLE_03845 [Turicibacter sp.]|uniref:hypothetical protein n=1 Tax=Turicibacter sp. GALT-G1 TaxID=2951140 RepID=UPI0021D4A95B|nr:hypothetical protein [Turicibacter sp. GALT-G1]MCU7206563.1 hypothetical protein [Turicibacter sp. GALT-G1]
MELQEYKKMLINTVLEHYPVYLQSKLLKYMTKDDRVINDRRKIKPGQGSLLSIDVTGIEGVGNKLCHLLDHAEEGLYAKIYKYVEEFEFVKGYRYACIFEYKEDLDIDMISSFDSSHIQLYYHDNDKYDCMWRTGSWIPTVNLEKDRVLFKYSVTLDNREGDKIKYVVLVVMELNSKRVSIYFDSVASEYKNPVKDFYAVMLDTIKRNFEKLIGINLLTIDFKAIIYYIQYLQNNNVHLSENIKVSAQKMKRDGTVSYLEAKKDSEEEPTIPILGELKEWLRERDYLFEVNEETRRIKEELSNFIEEIEQTSDYPKVQIRFRDKGFHLEMTHAYKNYEYSVFKIDGNLSDDRELIEYAKACLDKYYRELEART